jgi:small neutral amino acid transporter SnatA (MarC family)
MSREQLPDLVQQFLFGFATLFAIINPYGLSFIFLDRTLALSEAERKIVAKRVAVSAFCVLAVSLLAGTTILGFFGITLPALRSAVAWWSPFPAGRCCTGRPSKEIRRPAPLRLWRR